MLEKLAEIVRKGASHTVPCWACTNHICVDFAAYKGCPRTGNSDGSLMLARWAVLLVAQGLEKELKDEREWFNDFDCKTALIDRLLDLISEASSDGCKQAGEAGE